MTMLELLSENVALQDAVAEAQEMLTQVDIERLPSYMIGVERGEARGEAREKAQIARRLLTRFDAAEVADLLGLATEEIERIAASEDDKPEAY